MKGLALLLWTCAASAAEPAPRTSCEALKPFAPKLDIGRPVSTPNPVNCPPGEDSAASNYILPTAETAPYEMHVVSVHSGSRPSQDPSAGGGRGLEVVEVAVYKTRKPAVLALSAALPVKWNLRLTQESRVVEIILQGAPGQEVRGVPPDLPVIRRPMEESCSAAHAWEPAAQAGQDFPLMMESLRCFTGLRETSFQGCRSGFFFEVPHYRQQGRELYVSGDPPAACPLPGSTVRPILRVKTGPPSEENPAPGTDETIKAAPLRDRPDRPGPPAGSLPRPLGPKEGLDRPAGVPPRSDVPVRALAILLEGNRMLLTHDAIPDLIEALKKGDLLLRSRAADELGKMGPAAKAAVPALIEALRDPNDRLRAGAALALGNIGPAAQRALPLLKAALDDPNAEVRLSAELALDRMGTKKARAVLERHRRAAGPP